MLVNNNENKEEEEEMKKNDTELKIMKFKDVKTMASR